MSNLLIIKSRYRGKRLEKSRQKSRPSILFFIAYESAYPAWHRREGKRGWEQQRRLNYVPDANIAVLSGAAGVLHPSFSFLENSAHEIRGFASVHTLNTTRASEIDTRRPFPLSLASSWRRSMRLFLYPSLSRRIQNRSPIETRDRQTIRIVIKRFSRLNNKIQKQPSAKLSIRD